MAFLGLRHRPRNRTAWLKVSSVSWRTHSCSSACWLLSPFHLLVDIELTAEPAAFLDYIKDVLPDFNRIFLTLFALISSAPHSFQHVQGTFWLDCVVHIPKVILLRPICFFLITVVREILDELRVKPKRWLVHIDDLHSVELRHLNSSQIAISNKLSSQQSNLHPSCLSGYLSWNEWSTTKGWACRTCLGSDRLTTLPQHFVHLLSRSHLLFDWPDWDFDDIDVLKVH